MSRRHGRRGDQAHNPPTGIRLHGKRDPKPTCDNTGAPLHRALHGPFKGYHYHMVNKRGVLCVTPWKCMKVKSDDQD